MLIFNLFSELLRYKMLRSNSFNLKITTPIEVGLRFENGFFGKIVNASNDPKMTLEQQGWKLLPRAIAVSNIFALLILLDCVSRANAVTRVFRRATVREKPLLGRRWANNCQIWRERQPSIPISTQFFISILLDFLIFNEVFAFRFHYGSDDFKTLLLLQFCRRSVLHALCDRY